MSDRPPIWQPESTPAPPDYDGLPPMSVEERTRFDAEANRLAYGRRMDWTATELMAVAFPPVRWAIPGLIPEGLTVLAGKPKLGKSWLALGFALDVVGGRKALNTRQASRGEVLFLALEDSPRRIRSRLDRLAASNPAGFDHLHLRMNWRRLDHGGLNDLDRWLADHPSAVLVVVDTWQRIRAPIRGKDRYAEDYSALADLHTLAARHDVAMLLIHHLRKDDDPDDWTDSVSGSTGVTGSVDTVLALFRERGRMDATLRAVGRDLEEDAELALDFHAGRWSELGSAADYRLALERADVLKLFAHVDEIDASQVADALGITREAARQRLSRMARDGELQPLKRGWYSRPESPSQLSRVTTEDQERDLVTFVTEFLKGDPVTQPRPNPPPTSTETLDETKLQLLGGGGKPTGDRRQSRAPLARRVSVSATQTKTRFRDD